MVHVTATCLAARGPKNGICASSQSPICRRAQIEDKGDSERQAEHLWQREKCYFTLSQRWLFLCFDQDAWFRSLMGKKEVKPYMAISFPDRHLHFFSLRKCISKPLLLRPSC
jgi:hypothetical protein